MVRWLEVSLYRELAQGISLQILNFAPATSYELEILTHQAESLLQELGLHYRVVSLAAGDITFGAEFCYDLEVWIPSQQTYREISSCSLYGTFQARRCKIRTKRPGTSQTEYPATLNGSALPVGRTIIALLDSTLRSLGT
jgi:seryl-tRNA synthetase